MRMEGSQVGEKMGLHVERGKEQGKSPMVEEDWKKQGDGVAGGWRRRKERVVGQSGMGRHGGWS